MSAQTEFVEKANETLEEKALRVCEVIVSCGLGIRGGQITNGGNMVAVERAVFTIHKDELETLPLTENIGEPLSYPNGQYAKLLLISRARGLVEFAKALFTLNEQKKRRLFKRHGA